MPKPLVVITGASSGIGEEVARTFAREGHPLLLMARRIDRLKALNLPGCICAKVDVTDLEGFRAAMDRAQERFGHVDCLVSNAGVMLLSRAHLQDVREWQRMLDVNVTGMLNGIHLVLKDMIERRGGTIVNIASVAGLKPGPNLAVYSGTKFAVRAISESIREEAAPSDVRVTVISPGLTETELLEHTTVPELKASFEGMKEPLGGFLNPADVARAVWFAYSQPQDVCVREIVLAPTRQLR